MVRPNGDILALATMFDTIMMRGGTGILEHFPSLILE